MELGSLRISVSSHVNICILLQINRVCLVILVVLPFIFCHWGMAGSQQTTQGNSALSCLSSGCRHVMLPLHQLLAITHCKNWYTLYTRSQMLSSLFCIQKPKWNFTFCCQGPPILKINTSGLASTYLLSWAVCIDRAAALFGIFRKNEGSWSPGVLHLKKFNFHNLEI